MDLEEKIEDKESRRFFDKFHATVNKFLRISVYSLSALLILEGADWFFNNKDSFGQEEYYFKRITNNSYYDENPRWHPDGNKIMFYSYRNRKQLIYLIDADGSNETQLIALDSYDGFYDASWSPDGKNIALNALYTDSLYEQHSEIHVFNLENNGLIQLTNPITLKSNICPDWSPDGKYIIYNLQTTMEAWVNKIQFDGGEPATIIKLENHESAWYPVWSPDGEFIAFIHCDGNDRNIAKIPVDSNGVPTGPMIKLTDDNFSYKPSWSFDSKKIAYYSRTIEPIESIDIWIMDSDGNNKTRITNDKFIEVDPSWSPDGKKIAFSSNKDNYDPQIWVVYLEGRPEPLINLQKKTIIDNFASEKEDKSLLRRIWETIYEAANLGMPEEGVSTDSDIYLEFSGDVDQITKVKGYFSSPMFGYITPTFEFEKIEGKYFKRASFKNLTKLAIETGLYVMNNLTSGEDLSLDLDLSPVITFDSVVVDLTSGQKSFLIDTTLSRFDESLKSWTEKAFDLFGHYSGIIVHSPVEFLITDSDGNKLGMKDGKKYNDLPGYFNQDDDPKIAFLFGDNISLRLKATNDGEVSLTTYNAIGFVLDSVSYPEINVKKDYSLAVSIGANDTLRVYDQNNNQIDIVTYVKNQHLPEGYLLFQNYPNPFNELTKISFYLPRESSVSLNIYNILGQKVKTPVNERKPPGNYFIIWDGRNESGQIVHSGVYFYRLETAEFTSTKKMVLIK